MYFSPNLKRNLILFSSAPRILCAHASDESSWSGWKCDDLTPDLCDLTVNEGVVSVRGLSIHYWKYASQGQSGGKRQLYHDYEKSHEKERADFNLENGVVDQLPVVMINGGPCWAHNYMLPLRQIACRGFREVVFYDQGGTGLSSLPTDGEISVHYPWLLDISYYATEELPALISHLGYEKFHILGHSWGTMVAQVYALDAQEQGLQSLVLSGPLSDASLYEKEIWSDEVGAHGGISSMPPFIQSRIRTIVSQEAFDTLEYQALDDALLNMFLTRIHPFPDCLVDSFEGMNLEAYTGLFGSNDFVIEGTIKGFNITGELSKIHVPVLISNGEYDFIRPYQLDIMEDELPIVERVLFEKSAHNTMQDDAGKMNDVVSDFFLRVETALALKNNFNEWTDEGWMQLSSLLSDNLTGKERAWSSIRINSIFVLVTTFFVGVIFGLFLKARFDIRQGYEKLS